MGGYGKEDSVVRVESLHKRYGRRQVLKDLSFTLTGKSKLVIIGPNGSGKTTLIKVLLGLTGYNGGYVRVMGFDPRQRGFDRVRRRLGYAPERVSLPENLRVEDYLHIMAAAKGCSSYSGEADMLGLTSYMDSRIRTLSQGYKRRVMIAASLLCRPELVILDEPYANVDIVTRVQIDRVLSHEVESPLIITTHIEPKLEGYNVAIMIDGQLYTMARVDDIVKIVLMCGGRKVEIGGKDVENINRLVLKRGCRIESIQVVTFSSMIEKVFAEYNN